MRRISGAGCGTRPTGHLWDVHDVHAKTHGTKRFRHPVVGALTLAYETFRLHDDPDQVLVTYYPADPAGPDEHALRLLGSWAAG